MEELQAIGQGLQEAIQSRQRLEAQEQESTSVQAELQILSSGARVFKLTGPVLVPQERGEAAANVDKRLEFIRGEVARVDKAIADLSARRDAKQREIQSQA